MTLPTTELKQQQPQQSQQQQTTLANSFHITVAVERLQICLLHRYMCN